MKGATCTKERRNKERRKKVRWYDELKSEDKEEESDKKEMRMRVSMGAVPFLTLTAVFLFSSGSSVCSGKVL